MGLSVADVETVVVQICRRQPAKYTVMRDVLGRCYNDELLDAIDHLLADGRIVRAPIGGITHYRLTEKP